MRNKLCKYGYPYALLEDDGLVDSSIRYNYARYETEDTKVVSYNKGLLRAWKGHSNVRVTQLVLVRYAGA